MTPNKKKFIKIFFVLVSREGNYLKKMIMNEYGRFFRESFFNVFDKKKTNSFLILSNSLRDIVICRSGNIWFRFFIEAAFFPEETFF